MLPALFEKSNPEFHANRYFIHQKATGYSWVTDIFCQPIRVVLISDFHQSFHKYLFKLHTKTYLSRTSYVTYISFHPSRPFSNPIIMMSPVVQWYRHFVTLNTRTYISRHLNKKNPRNSVAEETKQIWSAKQNNDI